MTEVVPFDWYRMLIGIQSPFYLLEIIFRVVLIYGFGATLLRFMGKRGRRTMSPFELLVVIALGSATGDAMLYPEVPILHAWAVISAVVACEVALGHFQFRFTRVQRFMESVPRVVVPEGRLDHDALRAERLRPEELYSMLREAGVTDTGQVQYAFLELSGHLGLVRYPKEDIEPGQSTLATHLLQQQGLELS